MADGSRVINLSDRSAAHRLRESRVGYMPVCVGIAYDMRAQAPGLDLSAGEPKMSAGGCFVNHFNRIASAGMGSHFVATDKAGREFDVTITPRHPSSPLVA